MVLLKKKSPEPPKPTQLSEEKVETFEPVARDQVQETVAYDSTHDTQVHIKDVQALIEMFCKEMTRRGQVHDASKLKSPEKEGFDKFIPIMKTKEYGSKEYQDAMQLMKETVRQHYEANSHHPEHYGLMGMHGMNLFDLIEMVMDWKAASDRRNDGQLNLLASFERFNVDPMLRNIIKNTAEMLGWPVSHK